MQQQRRNPKVLQNKQMDMQRKDYLDACSRSKHEVKRSISCYQKQRKIRKHYRILAAMLLLGAVGIVQNKCKKQKRSEKQKKAEKLKK